MGIIFSYTPSEVIQKTKEEIYNKYPQVYLTNTATPWKDKTATLKLIIGFLGNLTCEKYKAFFVRLYGTQFKNIWFSKVAFQSSSPDKTSSWSDPF